MGYCLLSKFRGAWFGSLMGEGNSGLRGNSPLLSFSQPLSSQLSTQEIESIIEEPESLLNDLGGNSAQFPLSKLILSILPVILYYHDDWHYLSAFLRQTENSFPHIRSEIDSILVWCYVVRLTLRGENVSHGLANRVAIGTGLKQASAIQWLNRVETCCSNGFSSIQLMEELSFLENWEIPLSLFCFLNNSEDFYLTIQQALSLEGKKTKIAALSGILSGAYNGWTGIPVHWRNWCQEQDFYPEITNKIETIIKEWLGIDSLSNTMALSSVISSPKILQLRPDLKIISQQEY